VHSHVSTRALLYPICTTAACVLLAVAKGRFPWLTTAARILLGLEFAVPVADRLGLLGPHGTPGVSWGDFRHFIAYTAHVNAFAPAAIVPALAVLATIYEGTLAITLLLGVRTRIAALAALVLLCVYATAMTVSGLGFGDGSQFYYAVLVLAAAALVIAVTDRSQLSADGFFARFLRTNKAQVPKT